jgi:CTP:molybdopterin cytidylyltransferase MocA
MIPILILAGGTSSRMGGVDKLFEHVDGVRLLSLQIDRACQFGGLVYVALPSKDHPRLSLLEGTRALPLFVSSAAEGMGGTLRGAVPQLPECTAFMVLLADLAALEVADLATVIKAHRDSPDALIWRGTTAEGRAGHPIIFDASLRPEFEKLSGDNGGNRIVRSHSDRTCFVSLPDDHARLDLDTPDDWAQWRARTGR